MEENNERFTISGLQYSARLEEAQIRFRGGFEGKGFTRIATKLRFAARVYDRMTSC